MRLRSTTWELETMLIKPLPTAANPPTIQLRYPLPYTDQAPEVEYRWEISRAHWLAALDMLDNEPSLVALPVVDRGSRTLSGIALIDGYFGSSDRRDAIRRLVDLLFPPQVQRELGLPTRTDEPDDDGISTSNGPDSAEELYEYLMGWDLTIGDDRAITYNIVERLLEDAERQYGLTFLGWLDDVLDATEESWYIGGYFEDWTMLFESWAARRAKRARLPR